MDSWLTTGPSTRKAIRTYFVFAKKISLNMRVEIGHYRPKSRPTFAQEQRLAWLRELLTGTSESRPYRVAGALLLLYVQPLVRVAAPRPIEIDRPTEAVRISFTKHPMPVPEPFADLLRQHLQNRPNLRTGSGTESPWLFPASGQANTFTRTPSGQGQRTGTRSARRPKSGTR